MKSDRIAIRGLRAPTHVGVPEAERAESQCLELDVVLEPEQGFAALGDDFLKTIDYEAAANLVRRTVAERPRLLIETVAEEVAAALLAAFPLRRVEIEVRKFILPGVGHVAVSIQREARVNS